MDSSTKANVSRKKSSVGINVRAFFKTFYSEIFSYSTVREATVENRPVAIIYRIVQLCILAYIIGYDIILNKGYQAHDTASSTVTTKVKGLGYIGAARNATRNYMIPPSASDIVKELSKGAKYRVFDTSDYIIPANEYNSIFIMTNFIETIQSPGLCHEHPSKHNAKCNNDQDCLERHAMINTWNGIPTGRCIPTSDNKTKACEITAWCPVEYDPPDPDINMIENTWNFTIFIKNDIEFRRFNKKERNILPGISNDYISTCAFTKPRDPSCPVFLVNDILTEAEPDFTERIQMFKKGGVVQIAITWDCNYDFYVKNCYPNYSFKRFDLKYSQRSAASGFNFRFANKYMVDGVVYRTLYKAYGLRIIITVTGRAGKFSILPLMITVGAGFGLMGLSVLIADCILLNFTHKRKLFQKLKAIDAKEAYSNAELLKTDGVEL